MSIFTIEQALQPQGGGIAQLFIIFADTSQDKNVESFFQHIARAFSTAAIILATPSEALLHATALREEKLLSDEQIREFVRTHHDDIQGFIKAFQSHLNIGPSATALVGIGQIGSLVLELSKLPQPLSGRVISFGSRFAELPTEMISLDQTVHLLHASKDSLVPVSHTLAAQQAIAHCKGDATIDVAHIPEHSFDEELIKQMVQRLLTCVPLRYWKEAQGESSNAPPSSEGETLH